MDIEERVEEIALEVKVLKSEIRQILSDIREHVLNHSSGIY